MFLEVIIFCLISLPLIWHLIKLRKANRRFHSFMAKIPGPAVKYPIIGNIDIIFNHKSTPIINRLHDSHMELAEQFYDYGLFKFKQGPSYFVHIFKKDLVQDLLKSTSNLEKPFMYQMLSKWLGKGLLINDNTLLWKERRKLLTPAFHFKIIEDFVPVFNEKANVLVHKLNDLAEEENIDLCPILFSCTLDIICETTLGYQINSQLGQNYEYLEAIKRINVNFINRVIRPWLWPDLIYFRTKGGKQFRDDVKTAHELSRRVINERKQQILENNENNSQMSDKRGKRLAFLELLLDLHLKDNSLSLEDIREEVDTFMFAGHDTSAACLSWTFFLIGLYPEVQYKLQEELDSIVSQDEDITIDDMRRMHYLDAVIKESQRLYPPVPHFLRKITEEIELGNYTIPKGVTVCVMLKALHLDPNQFPDPFEFRPERFLKENQSESDNPFRFSPFSGGARNCIGQKFAINEMKVILTKVLTNFEIKSLEERNDVKAIHCVVSVPENGIKVKILPR